MNKVLDHLYIGGVFDFVDKIPREIDVVVKLYNGVHHKYPPIPTYIEVLDFPSIDGGEWTTRFFVDVLTSIHKKIIDGHTVAVCCAAGKSRSATIVLAYLCIYSDMNLREALFYLKKCRSEIDPSIYLLLSLVKFLDIRPYLSSLGELS